MLVVVQKALTDSRRLKVPQFFGEVVLILSRFLGLPHLPSTKRTERFAWGTGNVVGFKYVYKRRKGPAIGELCKALVDRLALRNLGFIQSSETLLTVLKSS